ncbi:unnamed protein product [Brachionus calyciflorus]|uniref:Uncharacterized protein n=1 Tax=Brachionus calyciflorus TaxID=104777 RepID=A0A813W1E5_9BILA|nr:unnamed protein product [Brachionus calyciflorus]
MILMTSIEDKILRRLTRKTAHEICKRILNARQDDNESVEDFMNRIQNFREEIEALGHKMTDQDIAMTIMQGLIREYEIFVQCLTINADINDPDDIDLDEIINSFIIEEKRRIEKNSLQ